MTERDSPTGAEKAAVEIQARMAELAISQAELIRLSGISDFTIRRLRMGEPWNYRLPNLRKLSLALGWPARHIEELLGADGDDTPPPTVPTGGLTREDLERMALELRNDLAVLEQGIAALADDPPASVPGKVAKAPKRTRPAPAAGLDD